MLVSEYNPVFQRQLSLIDFELLFIEAYPRYLKLNKKNGTEILIDLSWDWNLGKFYFSFKKRLSGSQVLIC